jgi:hypothetical protein
MFSHNIPARLRHSGGGSSGALEVYASHNMHSSGALEALFNHNMHSSGALEACAWKNIGSIKPYTAISRYRALKKLLQPGYTKPQQPLTSTLYCIK